MAVIGRLVGLSPDQLKAITKKQALMIRFDEEQALASLPALLPDAAERPAAIAIMREVGGAGGDIGAEGEALLARIEGILGLEPAPAAEGRRAGPRSLVAT